MLERCWFDACLTSAEGPGDRSSSAHDDRDQRQAARSISEAEQVVLHGGIGRRRTDGETWLWDGAEWTEISNATVEPPPSTSRLREMVLDPSRQRLVLLVGERVWEWDGRIGDWEEVAPPPAVLLPAIAMGYDPTRTAVLVFGQGGISAWDGNQWTDVGGAPLSSWLRPVHDSTRDRLVGVGWRGVFLPGASDPAPVRTWDGVAWNDITPGIEVPAARRGPSVAFDRARETIVLFGGITDEFTNLNDTWIWDGREWSLVSTSTAPSPRGFASMTYDERRRRIVLHGGIFQGPGGRSLHDTWEWDGEWRRVFSVRPTPVYPSDLAYDPGLEAVVAFDAAGSSWRWSGSDWVQLTPNVSPPAWSDWTWERDLRTSQLVLFDGIGSTWGWLSGRWSELVRTSGMPSREGHMMAAGLTGPIVLGGSEPGSAVWRSDLWRWTGSGWSEVEPAGEAPAPRWLGALEYDSVRNEHVVFGGSGPDALELNFADTWVLSPPTGVAAIFEPRFPADIRREGLLGLRVRFRCGGEWNGQPGAELVGWSGRTAGEWLQVGATDAGIGLGDGALIDVQADAEVARSLWIAFDEQPRMHLQCRRASPGGETDSGNGRIALDYAEVRLHYAP